MKILKTLTAFFLITAILFTSMPLAFAETETPKSYVEDFEGYTTADMMYDYSNTSNDQPFISYGNNSRNRFSAKYANLYINNSADFAHTGSKSMYGTTYHLWATTVVDLTPNTEYNLSFWYTYKGSITALDKITYGFFTADTVNCTGLEEISGMTITATHSGKVAVGEWVEGTLNFTTGDNTENMLFAYKFTDLNTDGSATINQTTLYVDDISITPVIPEYSYKKFFDFEEYSTSDLMWDYLNASNDQPFIGYSNKKVRQTQSWANLKITSDSTCVKNGSRAMYGTTPNQYATTKVDLLPNTQYYAEFWYTYKHNKGSKLTSITYGFYKTDADCTQIANLTDKGATVSIALNGEQNPAEWRKASMVFKTGTNVENLVFGYFYLDQYVDENGVTQKNKATLYVDDLLIKSVGEEDMSKITVNNKNTCFVEEVGCDFDATVIGSDISFKVLTEPGLTPKVTVNGTTLTATDGIYTCKTEETTLIEVDCGAADEGKPMQGKDRAGNDLTKYNREVYMKPIGENGTVYHESVLFYTGRDTAKLLYPVSEVINLRSYDLSTAYIKGVDYEITADGQIKRLEGSRIPVYTSPLVGGLNSSETNKTFTTADGQYLQFIGDTTYPKYAVAVTYEYTEKWPEGQGFQDYKIPSVAEDIPKVIEKLEKGEEVNIVVYGDSTSTGMSASGHPKINVAPYAETWMDMLIGTLRAQYPTAKINYENIAVGGKASAWGNTNLATQLATLSAAPDLMILAFGGNDLLGGVSATSFGTNTQNIITGLRNTANQNANKDAEVLLWSPKINNPVCTKYAVEKFLAYETALESVAQNNQGVGLARVTSYIADVFESKEATDYLNTNVNHGNDFCSRIIATGIIKAMTPKTAANNIFTLDGNRAALKTANGTTNKKGLRIYNKITKEFIAEKDITEFGFIVTLESLANGDLTFETEKYASGVAFNKEGKQIWEETDDAYIFTAYLYNIPKIKYGENYLFRAYAKDSNGNYYYSDAATLSVFDIVYAIDCGNSASGAAPSAEDIAAFNSFANEGDDFAAYDAWLSANGKQAGSLRSLNNK